MTNPWDVPPLPVRGDDDRNLTFLGVGKIITGWEIIETELSMLYSVFEGNPDGGEAMRNYGKGTIFRSRFEGLLRASDQFFIRRPDQLIEGNFRNLEEPIRGLADRRSEVAHGIVFNLQQIDHFAQNFVTEVSGKPQYAVVAPYYAIKLAGHDGLPDYAYTSVNLEDLFAAMVKYRRLIQNFRESILK